MHATTIQLDYGTRQRLRERRQELGLSQLQVAIDAGCTPSAVSLIETGERQPAIGLLAALLAALGMVLVIEGRYKMARRPNGEKCQPRRPVRIL